MTLISSFSRHLQVSNNYLWRFGIITSTKIPKSCYMKAETAAVRLFIFHLTQPVQEIVNLFVLYVYLGRQTW